MNAIRLLPFLSYISAISATVPRCEGVRKAEDCFSSASRHRSARPSAAVVAAVFLALCETASADSLWKEGNTRTMFEDKRASQVGDLLTIVVQENTTATKNNKTSTSKKSSLDASISSFLYSPGASTLLAKGGQLPAFKYGSASGFDGGGSINNSETIVAQVTVKVIDVLPNHNLVIEGTRETSFSGEKQNVVLHGLVRAEDITSANTVYSYNVGDAKITIVTKGSISDAQRKSWFTKLWDKFSPF